jgi:hypothetical protein
MYRICNYEQLHPCLIRDLAIVFLTSKISYLLLPNLTRKIEMGITKGDKLMIAIHLDQLNHRTNQ